MGSQDNYKVYIIWRFPSDKGVSVMSRPESSLGSLLAAASSSVTALQVRKNKQHTKQLLDLVSSNEFNQERRHKEQLLVTILELEKTRETFAQKLNQLNQELSVSINILSAEMREISKSNWSILEHLETRKEEREYEGKMFHLVTTVMDDLDNLTLIASEFPEYVLVRSNAWNGMFRSLKFGLEKFAQMEDSRKYDRARKVFNDLGNLIELLTKTTKKKDVKELDKCLAEYQMNLNQVSLSQTARKLEKSRLHRRKKKLAEHKKKERSMPQKNSQRETELLNEIDVLNQRIKECRGKVKHYTGFPPKIKDLRDEIDPLLTDNRFIESKILDHKRGEPWLFQSRTKKESWKAKRNEMIEDLNAIKAKIRSKQSDMLYLCHEIDVEYVSATNMISSSASRNRNRKKWGDKRKFAQDELTQKKAALKVIKKVSKLRLKNHQSETTDLKNQIEDMQKRIEDFSEQIQSNTEEARNALLQKAHLLPATYIAIN
jgi:hypothetical protein